MALSRRGFVRTLGVGAAGVFSGALVGARGAEAWQATGGRAPSPGSGPLVRLDSNENPLGPGPRTVEAIRAALGEASRYPHRAGDSLPEAIARFHAVPKEQVLVACGSGEILRIAVEAFVSPARPLVAALPTFETCTRTAQFLKYPVHEVPVDDHLALDLAAMEDRAAAGAGLVFFCNPNNPTGPVHGRTRVADFVAHVTKRAPDTMILIDEAYHDYVDDPSYSTAVPLALESPQVVVSRTFSKVYGLAGLRIGYAIGRRETLDRLAGWKLGNGINILGIRAAIAAVGDRAHVEEGRAANRRGREALRRSFVDMGYRVAESQGNFILVDVRRDAEAFAKECRAQGIAVGRPFPPLTTWSRITVGTEPEMRQATDVFRKVLAGSRSVSVS
jgi:histidinol-phosphate aminotransferase